MAGTAGCLAARQAAPVGSWVEEAGAHPEDGGGRTAAAGWSRTVCCPPSPAARLLDFIVYLPARGPAPPLPPLVHPSIHPPQPLWPHPPPLAPPPLYGSASWLLAPAAVRSSPPPRFLPRLQPMEIYVDDEAKLTLHGLVQHYVMLNEDQKNRKLNDLLDALDFNQVGG